MSSSIQQIPIEARHPERWAALDDPEFVLDADAGLVLSANGPARDLWGCEGGGLPVAVDAAMPAMRRLRALLDSPSDGDLTEPLVFWTPDGVVRLECLVMRPRAPERAAFRIRVLSNGAARSCDNGPDTLARAKLAHEIRTPVGAVISYAEVLRDEHFGALGDARYRTYASNIFDSAVHILRLVEDMLHGSRDRARPAPLTFTDVASDALIESSLVLARPMADSAGVELAVSLPADLPHVVADELSLKQILLNLLANAVKFSRRGDRVTVSAMHAADGGLHVAVVDTGPGMPSPPCATGDGHAGPRGAGAGTGTGFGLPLARALAQANGASLRIESAPGRGTCATLVIGKDRIVPV